MKVKDVKKVNVDKVESVGGVNIGKVENINIITVLPEEDDPLDDGPPSDFGEEDDGTAGEKADPKGGKTRPHPYAGCVADVAKEPLKWLRYWVDQQVWRWLNYRCEKAVCGRWSAIKHDPKLVQKYMETRESVASDAIRLIRRTNKGFFLNWFHNVALDAPFRGLGKSRPMGPMERERFEDLIDTFWAEACRAANLKLSGEKSNRSKTTKNNDGLVTDVEPIHSAE